MAELKVYRELEDYVGYGDAPVEMYCKDEADKVIAELKEQISQERSAKVDYKISADDLSNGIKDAYEEIDHHKYKRCLTLARLCHSKDCTMLHEASDSGTFFKESWFWKRALWYGKWHHKWLELAKKFNPNPTINRKEGRR